MGFVKADLPDDVHRALKIEAARRDRTITEITGEILLDHYEEHVGDGVVDQVRTGGAEDG